MLEMQRRKGLIPDDRHLMAINFIEIIGSEQFINHANQTHAIREICKYYGIELLQEEDLTKLVTLLSYSPSHNEIFYYAFYFAAWVKKEVPVYQRTFRTCDEQIIGRILEGGSL